MRYMTVRYMTARNILALFLILIFLGLIFPVGNSSAAEAPTIKLAEIIPLDQLILNVTKQSRTTGHTPSYLAFPKAKTELTPYARVTGSNLLNSPAARFVARKIFDRR